MSTCSYHSLHDTIPSGKDTCRPARSSDLSLVRSNNSRPRLKYSTHKARQILHHVSMPLPQPARHHPFGEGHVQACSVFGPEHGREQQQLHQSGTVVILQDPQHWTEIFAMPPLQLARYHSSGKGHGHARSVLGPERGAEKQRLPQHETMDLQHIRDGSEQAQKLAELCIGRHRYSYADSDTHSMHSASPAIQHPLKRIESLRSANECKIAPAASASWSAQDQPFGDRHGHTDTAPAQFCTREAHHELHNSAPGRLIMSASLFKPAIRRSDISLPRDVTSMSP